MVETPEKTGNGAPGAVDFVTLYLAARILQVAGFDAEGTAKALKEVYGVEVEPAEAEKWFNMVPPEVEENPTFSWFLRTLSSEKLPALQYIAGAALGDADRYGELRVKDLSFARAYANALAIVTGDPSAAAVREGRYGYHTRGCRPLMRLIKSGLWRILGYIDKYSEKMYFLSGLLDADGSISPRLDEMGKRLYMIQVSFHNTDEELIEFVMDLLRELGFTPRVYIYTRRSTCVINGKTAIRRKTLYMVYIQVALSKIDALTRLNLHCERKRKLLEFFLAVKKLPSKARYNEFKRRWKREKGKWLPREEPVEELKPLEVPEPEPVVQRYTTPIKCPRCRLPGTLTLVEERALVQIYVVHEKNSCKLGTLEVIGRGKRNGAIVACRICGRPGHIYVSNEDYTSHDGKHRYAYLRVRICHHIGEQRLCCTLITLKPPKEAGRSSEQSKSPNPTHAPTTQ